MFALLASEESSGRVLEYILNRAPCCKTETKLLSLRPYDFLSSFTLASLSKNIVYTCWLFSPNSLKLIDFDLYHLPETVLKKVSHDFFLCQNLSAIFAVDNLLLVTPAALALTLLFPRFLPGEGNLIC